MGLRRKLGEEEFQCRASQRPIPLRLEPVFNSARRAEATQPYLDFHISLSLNSL